MYKKGYLLLGNKNGMFGKISPMRNKNFSLDHNKKISIAKSGKKRNTIICLYCNRNIADGNYQRWHGEKCKYRYENETML